MSAFRIILAVFTIIIVIFTSIVIQNHGWNLFPAFFGDMLAMNWAGQFNLDFMCFLTLSGLWLAWRHHFSRLGIILGFIGFFGGIMFLAPYLFIMSLKSNGDMKALLLGQDRAKK